jgi:hypothetical protein
VRWYLDGRLAVEAGIVRVSGAEPQLVCAA